MRMRRETYEKLRRLYSGSPSKLALGQTAEAEEINLEPHELPASGIKKSPVGFCSQGPGSKITFRIDMRFCDWL